MALEHSGADSAKPAPERLRDPARPLVDKVVHQVPILRKEVLLLWGVIVRSECSRKIRLACKERYDSIEGVRLDADIRVKKKKQIGFGGGSATIPCRGWTLPLGIDENNCT